MKIKFSILIILLYALLVACAPNSIDNGENGPPTPDISASLTTTPQPEVPPTMTPWDAPVPATPDPGSVSLGDGVLTPLAPLPANATQVKLGYQERWFTYLVTRPIQEPTGPGPIPSTLMVLDTATGSSWEVTRSCNDFVCEFAWLSNGQLLWLEDGNVFVADVDGQNKRDLNAPEGMSELFGVSATDIAVLRGGDGSNLWRLYLPDGTFDAVPEAVPHTDAIPDFVTQNDLLYFTADGATAGLGYVTTYNPNPDLKLIALPLEAGSVPTLLAAPTGWQYPGRGGPPPLPPVALPGTPYWLPTETLWIEENGASIPLPLVFDAVTGEIVNLERLTGLGDQGYRINYTQLSPDRRWMGAYIEPNPTTQGQAPTQVMRFYVAPTDNLAGGMILTGTLDGWRSNPPAVVLKEYNGEQTPLFHVSLTDGTRTPIVETVAPFEFGNVTASSVALFVQPTVRQAETLVLDATGAIVGRQQIPPRHIVYEGGEEYRSEIVGAAGSRLYVFGGNPNDVESSTEHVLWRWDAGQ